MRKSWVAAAVLVVAGLVFAESKPGLVRTKAGVTYEGTVDEKTETVVVNVRGIETTFTRDEVESITYGTFEERWTADYDKLGKTDAAGRILAGRRAFDVKRYDLAERALRDAQATDPNNAEAAELLRTVNNQRKLEAAKGAPPSNPSPEGAQAVRPVSQWSMLTADQVNRVKQMEVRDEETKIRVAFTNNVQKKFYDSTPRLATEFPTYNAFRNAPSVVQATRIIRDAPADLVKDVKITNDPEIIVDYRNTAQPLILQGCATSQCHGGGGAAAGKFALVSPATDPAASYTNFYVLQSTKVKTKGGPPTAKTGGDMIAPDEAHMIDRMRPEQSLLLQYGLSDQYAEIKHPHVRGYTGIYPRGRDDPRYKQVLAFLQKLSPVQPNYGFDFKLERKGSGSTTQATQPTQP